MVHHREEDLIGIPFPNHSSDVLCSLNEQRRDGLLCDVVLIVRDQEYRTHRSVLAACSQYFKKLFTVTTGDGGDHRHAAAVYEIDFVAPESLTAILEFAYTSTLTVTASNVKEILNAAQLLEIPCIISVCLEIMDNNISERSLQSSEGRGGRTPPVMEASPPPSTSTYQRRFEVSSQAPSPEDPMRDKQTVVSCVAEHGESDLERLLHRIAPPGRPVPPNVHAGQASQPLAYLPGLLPPLHVALGLPGVPQAPSGPSSCPASTNGRSPQSRAPHNLPAAPLEGSRPLDLAVKREIIKEEMKEEEPLGVLHGNFLNEFSDSGLGGGVNAGAAASESHALGTLKDEADFRAYLSFLTSASQLGTLFPPWQLEEERKIKPKASQQCPICNKIIQGAGKLPRHMRTHTGEKPYMCTICEVRFTRQDKLKIHMRKHTGERPYICLHCNSKFVHNYDLKNHLRIHTGVRPYQCEHCYKSFTRSDHLHRHIKRQSCRVSRPRRGRKP
uniref:Zinc finger and BTB domain containing 7C n=1 Tax=Tetraodon nigroviridis TaxID=99883 RepID=H3DN44_TETNG